ncbi:MAG TPA: DUF4038 domain-containing protein [Chloroflexota bacterium]|nr:DUF4038 domain-containing protein [Chloroflexota bacterium]
MTERTVHLWGRFEASIDLPLAEGVDVDPLRQVRATAEFTGPSQQRRRVPGFWDGDSTWRVRFSPEAVGRWAYTLTANAAGTGNRANAATEGAFECVPYTGENPFYRHGPLRVSLDGRRLMHADGTPWFFLADTVWNGPMLASEDEWDLYVRTRKEQGFTAAQYVSTQWRTAPDGGPDGPTYWGRDKVERINPTFFQRIDQRQDALSEAGIAGVPVLLWAIKGGQYNETNPGNVLSEKDCALLAQYQVARWQAHPVIWILNGDGKYLGEEAERWRRIGRAVFGETERATRAPTMVHPGGQTWVGHEFKDEDWLDIVGYQSGHGDDEKAWRWIAEGPPATEWQSVPAKVVMNIESPYEDHISYQSKQRHPAVHVRRANYWSLMVSPTAGVTYGGHGIWGWDDGSGPPVAHPNTGVPKPWREALHLPGAWQMKHLAEIFESLPWWSFIPAQDLLREQPGKEDVLRYVTATRSEDGRTAVLYLAAGGQVHLNTAPLAGSLTATWIDPRDGTRRDAGRLQSSDTTLAAPDTQDWVLVLTAE